MKRSGSVERKTTETDIKVGLVLGEKGFGSISTSIPFFDHMLKLLSRHGFLNLTVKGTGDIDVDYHHLVEDVGICIGQALDKALGDRMGIRRYGFASVPMDESLSSVTVDISGRPFLVFNADLENKTVKDFDLSLFRDFFKGLSDHAGITLHINVEYGKNSHHIVESVFKAFARSLNVATAIDTRVEGVMSTKGVL